MVPPPGGGAGSPLWVRVGCSCFRLYQYYIFARSLSHMPPKSSFLGARHASPNQKIVKSRYLETKPLKFSPPKSLCGTVGSPWVSLATLFGFWETLIKFSESMILYGEKSFFTFFFLARFKSRTKNLHYRIKISRR